MDINTIFNAIALSSIYSCYGPPLQRDREDHRLRKFRAWLLRHEEKQQAEIARLQAQVATLERIIEREAEKTTKAGQP